MKFTIDNTGVRSGETINGIGGQTKGTVMSIRFKSNSFFPPYKPYFTMNNIFIRDRLNWGFFKDMSWQEREQWIYNNSTNNEYHLSDLDCEVQFISIGSDFTTKLTPQNQQFLMSGSWIPINDIYQMFPRKNGSRAKRHTLIFRGSNWELINLQDDQKLDYYFDAITEQYSNTPVRTRVSKFTFKNTNGILNYGFCDEEPYVSLDEFINPKVKSAIEWFTPSIHKSLIQKCIRVRPINVKISNELYPTEQVLSTSFCMLLMHPGSLVPNLQTFVIGAESAFKRLAISLIEDSTCTYQNMYTLFAAALAVRNSYKPSITMVKKCIEMATNGLNDSYFIYHNVNGSSLHPFFIQTIDMLKSLGSFEGDINMLMSVFENNLQTVKSSLPRPELMDIYHCIDQHSITDIAYFYRGIESNPADIFKTIWKNGTGINSRKEEFNVNPNVKTAQFHVWLLKTSEKQHLSTSSEKFLYDAEIDESWIAGLLGPIENKTTEGIIQSFFNPNNLSDIISIKKPSRDTDLNISEETKKYAASLVESQLSSAWRPIKSDMLEFDGLYCYQYGKFMLSINNQIIEWSEYCRLPREINYLNDEYNNYLINNTIDISLALNVTSNGIIRNPLTMIDDIILNLPLEVLYKLGVYLRNVKRVIEFNKISRDGTGTYLSVDQYDCKAFDVMLKFCVILPGVIEINKDFSFVVKKFVFWDIVRRKIFNLISKPNQTQWIYLFSDSRELKIHQQDAVDSIISRIDNGKRANIVWMDVGLGKTLIVMNVIGYLIANNKMPKYLVYVLTPSSMENIVQQLSLCGIPINVLNGTTCGNKTFYPMCINLVLHDHMRLLSNEMMSFANNAMFIFDEVHYMFEDSKRTSVCLELSKICNLFIAMTGTLIKGRNIDGNNLLEWVSQVVDFEVTKDNYMIGIASLISGKLDLGIKINYIETEISITDPQYLLTVDSKFGGSADRTNLAEAVKICFNTLTTNLAHRALQYLSIGVKCVFVVAQNKSMQEQIASTLRNSGINTFCVSKDNPINITSTSNPQNIQVVITTTRFDTGYDVTAATVMITAPWFVNQSVRTQLEGRIVRISQLSKEVYIDTLHCGILSYVMNNHKLAKELAQSIRGIQKDIN